MKRIVALSILFVTAIFLYGIQKVLPDIYFNMGKTAFESRDYQNAHNFLKFAIELNGKDRNYRYYFVQTLLKMPPTIEVQKDLFSVADKKIPDSADLLAEQRISEWKNSIFLNIGENYIEKAPFNDKILRWDASKFPLVVNIQNNSQNAPNYYIPTIKKAFMQWQGSTGGFIKFIFQNSNDANIFVSINPQDTSKTCRGNDCKYVVAYTTPTIKGDKLQKMDIKFYDSNNLGMPFGQRELYNTALHEIGHSLGIMGHSFNKDDLMYMENNQEKISDTYRSDFQLISPRDLNTLNLLYKLIPDITNSEISKFDTKGQFFAPIVMGSEEEVNSRKLVEAQNYIKGAPELPNGYIDLGAAYAELKQYNNAINAMNKALDLSSNDGEKFAINYNLAVIYSQVKDWQNALKYARVAKSLQNSPDIDGFIAMIIYETGDKEAAKVAYSEVLKENPQDIIGAVNLSRIYLKEFNLPQAGKVLNNLVKANPQAANDPRVKAFGVLMFLFK